MRSAGVKELLARRAGHLLPALFQEARKASYLSHIPYYRSYYDAYRRRGMSALGRRFKSKYGG